MEIFNYAFQKIALFGLLTMNILQIPFFYFIISFRFDSKPRTGVLNVNTVIFLAAHFPNTFRFVCGSESCESKRVDRADKNTKV